jgi:prophage regulatory protein
MLEITQKERFLRLSDVKERTGLSRSTIYLNISKNIFPRPISLGARCVGWLESEIDEWMHVRIQQRSNLSKQLFP